MTKEIEIDDDVLEGLKILAEPFVDTPNTVIKRLLEEKGILTLSKGIISNTRKQALTPPKEGIISSARKGALTPPNRYYGGEGIIARTRAKHGEVTSQVTYEKYLLKSLWKDFKGHAPKSEVTEVVIANMEEAGILKEIDYEAVSTGESRAENTIAWSRNALKERGLIKDDSPRGIWELTQEGIYEAKELLGMANC